MTYNLFYLNRQRRKNFIMHKFSQSRMVVQLQLNYNLESLQERRLQNMDGGWSKRKVL